MEEKALLVEAAIQETTQEPAQKNETVLRTITLCSGKGGVGKTLLTASLARILRREENCNVLLVDLDLAVRGLTLLAFQNKAALGRMPYALNDYLFGGPTVEQELFEELHKSLHNTEAATSSFYQRLDKIFILPSSLESERVEWAQPARLEFDHALAKLKQIQAFVREFLPVRYLIFDTQAGLGSLSLAAAMISDVNLIVLEEDDISWRTALAILVEISDLSKHQQSRAKNYFLANKASPGLLDVAKKLKSFSFLPPLLYDLWLQRLFAQATSTVFDRELESTNFFRQMNTQLWQDLSAILGIPPSPTKNQSPFGSWWRRMRGNP